MDYLSKKFVYKQTNYFLSSIGGLTLWVCERLGSIGIFVIDTTTTSFRKGIDLRKIIFQMNFVGVNTLNVVALTGSTIGAVLAVHAFNALNRFGGAQDQFIGPLIYLSMTREFGPMVGAIMLTARAGSAMAAELGSMKISEQVDALKTLSIDPLKYLIAPRIIATTIIMPFLSLFCTICGILTGYLMSVHVLGVSSEIYIDSIRKNVVMTDITYGLIKAIAFGFLTSTICCFKGLNTFGGSRGVGISTTEAVVFSCVTIFFANYILSSFLFPA